MHPSDFVLSLNIERVSAGKSSLLIPAQQYSYFIERCKHFGSRSAYLGWMIQNYVPRLSELKGKLNNQRELNWNTSYQSKGQSLIKRNFMPNAQDWECLRQAAGVCAVSMCFLFVFLMQMEAEGRFKKNLQKSPLERNSIPKRVEKRKKFKKFSKFLRKLDFRSQTLHRRLS